MAEGIFWIFISFFAVLGLFDFLRMIQSYLCRREAENNVMLIPVGNDSAVSAECRIHTAVAECTESVALSGRILVADVGMDDKTREICKRLCEQYDLQMVSLSEVPDTVINICSKRK